MLMCVNNSLVNEICNHGGSTANELAVLYVALMVTIGRLGGGGLAVKEACSAALPLCPHTAVMKWLHPSCWLSVKNSLIWLLSRWQMGAAASFSLWKGRDPWLLDLRTALSVSEGAAALESWERVQIHTDKVMSSSRGLLLLPLTLMMLTKRVIHDKSLDCKATKINVVICWYHTYEWKWK